MNADDGSEKDVDPGDEWLMLVALSDMTDGTHGITLQNTHEFTFYDTHGNMLWNTLEFTFYNALEIAFSSVREITAEKTHEFTPPFIVFWHNPETISSLSSHM